MKVLVTGIAGFIGRKLLKHLAASDEIVAVDCRPVDGLPENVRFIKADLNDPSALFESLRAIRPDSCIHLAWEGIPDFGFENSQRNLRQGAALFHCLVEECGCRKIVAMGSCLEYGKAFGPCRENDPVAASSYFVWAKRALFDFGMTLAAKNGISFVWTRPFYVYGPGQRDGSLIPTLVEALKTGERPAVKAPHNANDFVFIDDVAEALAAALLKNAPTGSYNLGTGKTAPVWKVCEILEKSIGLEPRHAAEMKRSAVSAATDFWADTAKSEKILGWRARTGIEEGIRQYVKVSEAKE